MKTFKDQILLKIHPVVEGRNPGPYFVGPFDNEGEADLWARLNIWSAGYDYVTLIHPWNAKDGLF